jgi:type III restriction enzyme
MRENYCLDVSKCIYPKLQYPSNKWWLEKDFIEFCDNDSKVEAFCKINEYKHTFLRFRYIRTDWIPAYYSPDFVVKTAEKIFLVETKSNSAAEADENVRRKKKSALNYLNRVNELEPENRDNREREYVLLNEWSFYTFKNNNGNILEMLNYTKLNETKNTLF